MPPCPVLPGQLDQLVLSQEAEDAPTTGWQPEPSPLQSPHHRPLKRQNGTGASRTGSEGAGIQLLPEQPPSKAAPAGRGSEQWEPQ